MFLRQITTNTNEGIFDIFKSKKELKGIEFEKSPYSRDK